MKTKNLILIMSMLSMAGCQSFPEFFVEELDQSESLSELSDEQVRSVLAEDDRVRAAYRDQFPEAACLEHFFWNDAPDNFNHCGATDLEVCAQEHCREGDNVCLRQNCRHVIEPCVLRACEEQVSECVQTGPSNYIPDDERIPRLRENNDYYQDLTQCRDISIEQYGECIEAIAFSAMVHMNPLSCSDFPAWFDNEIPYQPTPAVVACSEPLNQIADREECEQFQD